MPIFEYKCDDCGTQFEKLVRRLDAGQISCPSCSSPKLTQQLSTFAAHSGGSSSKSALPQCPSGGMCPTPGACGLN